MLAPDRCPHPIDTRLAYNKIKNDKPGDEFSRPRSGGQLRLFEPITASACFHKTLIAAIINAEHRNDSVVAKGSLDLLIKSKFESNVHVHSFK
jgi:hypothetical protein